MVNLYGIVQHSAVHLSSNKLKTTKTDFKREGNISPGCHFLSHDLQFSFINQSSTAECPVCTAALVWTEWSHSNALCCIALSRAVLDFVMVYSINVMLMHHILTCDGGDLEVAVEVCKLLLLVQPCGG